MLELNTEIVCNVISKAREFQVKEGVIFSEDSSDAGGYDPMQVLANHQDDMTYLEFKNLINTLEPDQQEELIALMFIGRGDYLVAEFDEAKEAAIEVDAISRADYLLSKPLLADYLEEALNLFGHSCSE